MWEGDHYSLFIIHYSALLLLLLCKFKPRSVSRALWISATVWRSSAVMYPRSPAESGNTLQHRELLVTSRESQRSSSRVAFWQATMTDASWNFQMAAHVIANLYNKRVKSSNSPLMNQYAGGFHTRGRRWETNNLVCVALRLCRLTKYTWRQPFSTPLTPPGSATVTYEFNMPETVCWRCEMGALH